MKDINLIAIFLTGLLTGGLTCMAVQGGLLASSIAQREEERLKEKVKTGHAFSILVFVVTKLIAYTILGLFLGWLGSYIKFSVGFQISLQIAVAIFMIGTALALLEVHPFFRYFIIQPPKFITKRVRNVSKSKNIFAPAILGALTVFIPCGTTQAMMALAVGSGNALFGALVMFAFVLGTSPIFFVLGYFASKLSDALHTKFLKIAAYAIIVLAIFNLNNTAALMGSRINLVTYIKTGFCSMAFCDNNTSTGAKELSQIAVSEQTIEITNSGYTPRNFSVKTGSEVTLHLINKDTWSCAQSFTIPKLGLQKVVRPGQSEDLKFTAPVKPTQISFNCSMGMYPGVINVIN